MPAPKADALPKGARKMLDCLGLFCENCKYRVREWSVCRAKKLSLKREKLKKIL